MKAKEISVNVQFIHPLWNEYELKYGTSHSVGLDLRACIDHDYIEIEPGQKTTIGTGIAIEIKEPGVAGFLYSRSGLGTKEGLTVSQGVGVIDPDYRGEIKVSLLNTSGEKRRVRQGQRIAQLVFKTCYQASITAVKQLTGTERGSGGFGHTGKI